MSPTNTGVGWDRGIVSTSTVATESTVYGDAVQIWWQSSDEAVLAAAAAETSSASRTGQVQGSTTGQTSLPVTWYTGSLTPSNPGGISTGAKAGIGAGIGAAFLLSIATGVFLFLRRKTRTIVYDVQMPPEAGEAVLVEKESPERPQELPGYVLPAELHGNQAQASASLNGRAQ